MSITKDFEKGRVYRGIGYHPEDVDKLLAHARALETRNEALKAMVVKLSRNRLWKDDNTPLSTMNSECRFCGHREGHDPDCALGKLLEGVE